MSNFRIHMEPHLIPHSFPRILSFLLFFSCPFPFLSTLFYYVEQFLLGFFVCLFLQRPFSNVVSMNKYIITMRSVFVLLLLNVTDKIKYTQHKEYGQYIVITLYGGRWLLDLSQRAFCNVFKCSITCRQMVTRLITVSIL